MNFFWNRRGRLLRAVVASASKGCCISNHPPHNEPHLCDTVPAQTLAHDRLSLGEVFITQWMVMQSALIFEVFHDVCKSVIQPKLRKRHGICKISVKHYVERDLSFSLTGVWRKEVTRGAWVKHELAILDTVCSWLGCRWVIRQYTLFAEALNESAGALRCQLLTCAEWEALREPRADQSINCF